MPKSRRHGRARTLGSIVGFLVVAVGCSSSGDDTVAPVDTDSGSFDSAVDRDSAVIDSSVADSSVAPDTAVPIDTAPAPDTATGDTVSSDSDATSDADASDAPALVNVKVTRVDLASDQAGAAHLDANLVNAWGLAFSPSGTAWVSANHTGLATLYGLDGTPKTLVVTNPTAAGGTPPSSPTGQIFNPTAAEFSGDKFILDSEDGTITGWQTGTAAVVRFDGSTSGAVYKGLALVTATTGNMLLAANFAKGTVDAFDTTYKPITKTGFFVDATIPAGFAPFNVAYFDGNVYVTYAKQDAAKHDDAPGPGNGYVDVFDTAGVLKKRLISGGVLDSPWGVAKVPTGFGTIGDSLLVGNFGDGQVHVFDATTGAHKGQLVLSSGAPLVLEGLWALTFFTSALEAGTTTHLYFTSGPGGEAHGVFGRLDLLP